MATWSPELLLILPIRGQTETVLHTQDKKGQYVLWVSDKRPPQAVS